MKLVLVVAAALIDADGRVLLAQRPKGKALEGLWEFPGGKVDTGEAPEDALIRELMEELGDYGRSGLPRAADFRQPCVPRLPPLDERWTSAGAGRASFSRATVRR